MKKRIELLLIFWALACAYNLAAQDEPVLTDEAQTLPVESSADESPSLSTQSLEAGTEVLPSESEAPATPPVSEPEQEAAIESKKAAIVSEEDLLKPDSEVRKKRESKVKKDKITESELYIQEANKYKLTDVFKNLELNSVIEQGLRKNYDQQIKGQRQRINELVFDGAKSAFWLPKLQLNLVTGPQHVSTIRSSNRPPLTPAANTPTGALGLVLGDYTVFNWGKDYALYLNTKSTFERNVGTLDESKRELKLSLIENYFSLITTNAVEKIRQDQLRHASFIYRLNKEKITIGKTSKQDYYQARSEYLKAQNDYHQARMDNDFTHEAMAYAIADDVGTKYVLNENLDYRRIKITLEDAITSAKKQNPTILSNKTALENALRSYDVAKKENLPLPKFTMNLGAYTKRFGPTSNQTNYETYPGSGRVDLVASINATWSITGEDGFLNSNKLGISRIEKELALKDLEKNDHLVQSVIRQTYKNILSLQNQVVILEARLPTLQKTFDTILDNYLNNKTKYNDVHLALSELTETKILFEQYKLLHLKEKLNLAKLSGLEDFPGENFEHLAVRIRGK